MDAQLSSRGTPGGPLHGAALEACLWTPGVCEAAARWRTSRRRGLILGWPHLGLSLGCRG